MVMSVFWALTVIPGITAQFAGSTFTPARPPAIPLAVRSPYLSVWQGAGADGSNGGYLAGQWPTFWTGSINGWCGLVRVDNETYTWMGKPDPLPQVVKQTAAEYTSTSSTFVMDVNGLVTLNITFLSPVDPKDKQRQSMPVSYMNVAVHSADGNSHDVSIYTDISAEWASGDRNQVAEWSSGTAQGSSDSGSGSLAFHKFWRQNQAEFVEDGDQAAWGYWYYVTEDVDGLTRRSGADVDVRAQFTNRGSLDDTQDNNFRAINDAYPVFAFASDLGSVAQNPIERLFTVNLLQNNSVQFTTEPGRTEQIPSYWTNFFSDELSAITTFFYDHDNAVQVSSALDSDVRSDAEAVARDDYAAIVSLAVRQAWGAVQIAGSTEKSYMFLKEISSNGNFQTVDVIFPFHPILLYMNPAWMKMILDPLFINQESGQWPEDFAIHDIGSHYPNATGHPDGNAALQPLEECGNMLIMTLAYAQRTGDNNYLAQHWEILHQWGQWLITNNSVVPFNQISTGMYADASARFDNLTDFHLDDFAGKLANQTNLALKGIIGLQAASMIADLTGHSNEADRYHSTAQDWIRQWQELAINQDADPPHTVLNYGAADSHSLLYNLYADSLLQANIVPRSVYTMQSDFYPTVEEQYGVALDTRASRTKSDWQLFCAAIASEETRDMFIRDLLKFINQTPTNAPTTDFHDVATGTSVSNFRARPVVGGWFSLLALNQTGIPDRS